MRCCANRFLDRVMWLLVGVMALALINGHAVGQCELDKLLASDGASSDFFGFSVSISGDPGTEVAIVGAYRDDDNGSASGSAYIYRKSGETWVQESKLLASDGAAGDAFGFSVSISGDSGNEVVIVGAYLDDDNGSDSGSAYIFRYDPLLLPLPGWTEEDKLLASTGAASDQFGFSVSISGDSGNEVVIVGAYLDDDNGSDSGSAYIFRYDPLLLPLPGWVQEAQLHASDGASFDRFGGSVSISGPSGNEVAIVGAYKDDSNFGSAYIYRFNGVSWVEEAKLLASDGATGDNFGKAVSISSDPGNEVVIVGAYHDDDNGSNSGSSYIYRKTGATWVQEAKLIASDGAASDNFGFSVSISGDAGNEVVIVGAYFHDDSGTDSGSAYIYRFNGVSWMEEARLLPPDGASGDRLGNSVSISGTAGSEVVIVGAHLDDDNGSNSGSMYLFECPLCPADTNGDKSVNVTDLLAMLAAWGFCPPFCPHDIHTDGTVNVADLLALLAAWGACP